MSARRLQGPVGYEDLTHTDSPLFLSQKSGVEQTIDMKRARKNGTRTVVEARRAAMTTTSDAIVSSTF